MIADLLVPLVTVGAAELGDKTQLAILLLATRTRKHFKLLAGAVLGFAFVDGFAVITGAWIATLVSIAHIKFASAVVFIFFGLLILKEGESEVEKNISSKNPFYSSFTLIFLTEWGDKTQVVTGLFAASRNPFLVLAGALTALTLLSAAAIYAGSFVSQRVDKVKVKKIAGAVFIAMGLLSFLLWI